MADTLNPESVCDAVALSGSDGTRPVSKGQEKDTIEICKIILPVGIAATLGAISLMCAVCAKTEKLKERSAAPRQIAAQPTVDTNAVQSVQKTLERGK